MDYGKKRELILNGSMPKVLLTLAAPIMLNNFVQTLYSLADTYWVSTTLGTTEVASIMLVFPVIFLTLSLGMGVNIAGTALISQFTGSDDQKSSSRVAGQMFSFSIILSIVLSIIGFFATPTIVSLMGGEGEVHKYASEYLSIMFWELPFIFLFFVYNSIKQGQGDTVTPMKLNVSGVILNIILSPIFIVVFKLGVGGAALATVFSRGLFAAYAGYTLFAHKNGISLSVKDLKIEKEVLYKIIRVGLPATIGQSASAFGFIFLNAFVLAYGSDTMAAFGIGNRINSLVLMPVMGTGAALATIIGQNLGAEQTDRAKLAFKTAMKISTIFMVIGSTIMFFLAETIVGVFIKDDPVVFQQSLEYLRLISASLPLMGFFQVFVGTFQGSGHTLYAMIMDMGRLWGLRIPLIMLFGKFTTWGSSGVWYAMVLSNGLICCVGLVIYLMGNWQEKVIHKNILAEQ